VGVNRSTPCPCRYEKGLITTDQIKEYYDNGYSLIPLKKNSKIPCIKWKKYQNKRAGFDDVLGWYKNFDNPNIGIITGGISSLTVVDVDDTSILPELIKQVPEINETTKVKTKRGYHFYFSGNGINSTNNLLNMGVELKSGGYIVAPPSIIDGVTYTFEIPLSEIKPLPIYLIEKERYKITDVKYEKKKEGFKAPDIEYKNRRVLELPYYGKKVDCIRQILSRDLQAGERDNSFVGERDNSLYILFNLLLQNKNALNYSQKIVRDKNLSLTKPLSQKEVENLFKKVYNYKCSSIIEKLPYIDCDSCEFKFKGGKLKMNNPIIHNLRRLGELEAGEQRVLLFLGSYFQGEKPLQSEIIKVSKLSKSTVIRAMKGLREKQFINY